MFCVLRPCPYLHLRRFFCRSTGAGVGGGAAPDLARYKEVFARRMAMAGIKPHHRIALGVSGGPDSMALCVLTAGWKLDASVAARNEATGFIDGLLGIVVDHRLRTESADEAVLVRDRVQNMGIRCEIVNCDWPDGRPKLGHLQESAREMRYKMLQGVCIEQQTGILLIAHHADDQAELLILRLSRNSGVLGLAGMPFVSQLFPEFVSCEKDSRYDGILLVRPMMEFSKDDMYKVNTSTALNVPMFLLALMFCGCLLSGNMQMLCLYNCDTIMRKTYTDKEEAARCAAELRTSIGTLPITYLGLPLSDRHISSRGWTLVLERMEQRLEGWSSRLLSRGGRLILLSSVLSTLSAYYMTIFRTPAQIIRRMDSFRSRFFWQGCRSNRRGVHLVAWSSSVVPLPRED